jgi:hypothetical protein
MTGTGFTRARGLQKLGTYFHMGIGKEVFYCLVTKCIQYTCIEYMVPKAMFRGGAFAL